LNKIFIYLIDIFINLIGQKKTGDFHAGLRIVIGHTPYSSLDWLQWLSHNYLIIKQEIKTRSLEQAG
jgi:hypothetical protein